MIARTRSSSTRTSPISDAGPTRTFSQPGGSSDFGHQLGEEERGERRLRRGLEDGCAAGRERGGDLVRDEVEREVEGRDRADDADRLPQREGELPGARLRGVHRDHLAGELARLDRREREGGHRAGGLDAGGLERLARLGRDGLRDLLMAASELARDADEDLGPLVRRQRLPHRSLGGVDGAPGLGRARLRDPPDDVAGIGGAHLDPVAGLDPLAGDQEPLLESGCRHAIRYIRLVASRKGTWACRRRSAGYPCHFSCIVKPLSAEHRLDFAGGALNDTEPKQIAAKHCSCQSN